MSEDGLESEHDNTSANLGADESQSTNTIVVQRSSLRKLSARPPLPEYVRQLWRRRYFLQEDATAKAFRTPRDLWMGKVWLIVSPLIDSVMYAMIFGLIVRTNNGIQNFPGYVVLGVTFFQIFQKYIADGNDLVKKQQNLVKSFMFPRAALVLSQSLRLFYSTAVPVLVAIVFTLLTQWKEPIHWTIIFVVPLFFLAHIFGTGIMFIVARITTFYPDMETLFRVGQRFWFYSSGVFFSVDRFVEQPILREVMRANPGYKFLMAARESVMYGQLPTMELWGPILAWSFGMFAVGFVFFWQAEERYVTVK